MKKVWAVLLAMFMVFASLSGAATPAMAAAGGNSNGNGQSGYVGSYDTPGGDYTFGLVGDLLDWLLGKDNKKDKDNDVDKTDPNNGVWEDPYALLYDTAEAEMMMRVGDIDNLNTGWSREPNGYDPFSGKRTTTHGYGGMNKNIEPDDPQGTDRIMIGTKAYKEGIKPQDRFSPENHNRETEDGYSKEISGNEKEHGKNGWKYYPKSVTQPIVLDYAKALDHDGRTVVVQKAVLQMFLDDFQPKKFYSQYKVTINGKRAYFIEEIIADMNQHGPVGELVTVEVPREYLDLVKSGHLEILFDDDTTGYGDGFAVDFIKLLINPVGYEYTATITGTVKDEKGKPLADATVMASNVVWAATDANGNYKLEKVPAGHVKVTASKAGYSTESVELDEVIGGQTRSNVNFTLKNLGDFLPPVGSIQINHGAETTGDARVTVTVSAADPQPDDPDIQPTGLDKMRIGDPNLWNDQSWIPYEAGDRSYTLPTGIGQKQVAAQFKDKAGNVSEIVYDTILLHADLQSLTVTYGIPSEMADLKPAFDKSKKEYEATVPANTSQVAVTASPVDPTAILHMGVDTDHNDVVEGDEWKAVASGTPLTFTGVPNAGSLDIHVRVTTADGNTYQIYKVAVSAKKSDNADLASLTVTPAGDWAPAFNPSITSYGVTVPVKTTQVNVTASPADSKATLEMGSDADHDGDVDSWTLVASGTPLGFTGVNSSTPLNISVRVTAEDGTQKVYQVAVTAKKSNNANLAKLTVVDKDNPDNKLMEQNNPAVALAVKANAGAQSATLIPVAADSAATVTITPGSTVNLTSMITKATITVTAEDGTQKTYTVTIVKPNPPAVSNGDNNKPVNIGQFDTR